MKKILAVLLAALMCVTPISVCAFQFNDGTLEWGSCTEHVYDNACDTNCNKCNLVRAVDPHPYVGVVTTPATCGAEGVKTYTCSACGDRYTASIPATGEHVYDMVVTDPTCEEKGKTTYVCEDCGHKYTINTPATGHNYKKEIVEPRCDAEGYDLYTCKTCGDSYKDNFVPARTEHGFIPGNEFWSCTEQCYTEYFCLYCGYFYREYREPTGHSPQIWPTIWLCKQYTYCNNPWCNEILIPATGHLYTDEVERKEPTCTEDGYIEYCCYGCPSYQKEILPATGHTYADPCTDACSDCGATRTPPHRYADPYDADCDLCGATRAVKERQQGDVNGDGNINVRDLGMLQQHLNGWDVFISLEAANVDGNSSVNVRDLGVLQKYLNGWDVTLQ